MGAIKRDTFFKILLVMLSHPVELDIFSFFIILIVFEIVIGGMCNLFLTLGLSFSRIFMGDMSDLLKDFLISLIFLT